MIRVLFLLILMQVLLLACKSQSADQADTAATQQADQEATKAIHISEGTYQATVDVSNVEDDLRAYNQTSRIGFSFEANQKFVYMVRAMGKEIDDVGKWQIIKDSLYIFDLERGPNSAFHIEETGPDTYRISGPNVFTLTKVAEKPAPLKN